MNDRAIDIEILTKLCEWECYALHEEAYRRMIFPKGTPSRDRSPFLAEPNGDEEWAARAEYPRLTESLDACRDFIFPAMHQRGCLLDLTSSVMDDGIFYDAVFVGDVADYTGDESKSASEAICNAVLAYLKAQEAPNAPDSAAPDQKGEKK